MSTTTDNGNGTFSIADDQGHSVIVSLKDVGTPGWVGLDLEFGDGIHQDPIKVKMTNSGGRVAGEFPGCNPGYCIVDANGKITNG